MDNILGVQGFQTFSSGHIFPGVSGGIVATLCWVKSRGGSKVGLIEPFYTYHVFQIESFFGAGSIHYVKSEDHTKNFAPNWYQTSCMVLTWRDNIRAAIAAKVDLLIVCNPGNPTGRAWYLKCERKLTFRSAEELKTLIGLAKGANIPLLVDECYSDMVWAPNVHQSPIQESCEDLVVVVFLFLGLPE